MDRAVAPGDDFYAFANGGWQALAVIPPERSHVGPVLAVQELVAARVRAIDEEAARAGAPPGSEVQQIGDFYASFMDEEGIEARGLAPLRPTLDRIAAIADRRALAAELGGSIRADVDALNATDLATGNVLGLWVEQDLNVPARNAAYLLQGGLGLPDRSYYLDEGGGFPELRVRYRAHLAAMFRLSGVPAAEAEARAGRVLDARDPHRAEPRHPRRDLRRGEGQQPLGPFRFRRPGARDGLGRLPGRGRARPAAGASSSGTRRRWRGSRRSRGASRSTPGRSTWRPARWSTRPPSCRGPSSRRTSASTGRS